MLTSDFDYELPEKLIAQTPAEVRDECRMLVLHKDSGEIEHKSFKDIVDYVSPGDLLIANETRVIPARLIGKKRGTGGVCEILLLRPMIENKVNSKVAKWEALVRPGKRLKPGSDAVIEFFDIKGNVAIKARIIDWAKDLKNAQKGERVAELTTELPSLDEALHEVGKVPLPPYIHDYSGDEEMYQTVYSKHEGSAAAPTAGLHFTPELILKCEEKGVGWATVDLEVGLDTFRLVDEENAEDHAMHTETYSVPESTVNAINETRANGGRVFAVGTTSVRSLESCFLRTNSIEPCCRAATSLYLMPGSHFNVVDAMITNFHVPRSTLMMLVSAFAGRDNIMNAYEEAKKVGYRFLSFGDAMLLV